MTLENQCIQVEYPILYYRCTIPTINCGFEYVSSKRAYRVKFIELDTKVSL